ncbi:hypothetical protein [Bacillus sp. EAC]|uniref:hypothetical protein n=1 Tax=Bacillus sp. EAC TaxID=1978338 RepID=UPI000B438FC0|nr:hypothetical protein [Bacillus sp. EAC]
MKYFTLLLLSLFLVAGCSKNAGTESNTKFKTSPTFALPVTSVDGTKGEYILIGQKGKVGLQIGSGQKGKGKVEPIFEGKSNKYMWYFWGSEEEMRGELEIKGIHEDGHTGMALHVSNVFNLNEKGAIETYPTMMDFSKSGKWKLDVYIGDKLLGTVVVDVEKAS